MDPRGTVSIRRFDPGDRDDVRRISCATALLGEPLTPCFDEDGTPADVLTLYFTDYEPGSCFVALDDGGVLGYVVGAKNVGAMRRTFGLKVVPRLVMGAARSRVFLRRKSLLFILHSLMGLLREFGPTRVFVSHPSDHNSDHQSLYLFLRVALWDLSDGSGSDGSGPAVYPYMVHYGRWPKPRGYHPEDMMMPPPLLEQVSQWESHALGGREVERKEAALREHKSQLETSSKYLESFVRVNEIFGDLPDVTLSSGGTVLSLSAGHGTSDEELPEQLLDEERRSFIGIRERHADLRDGRLVLSVKLSRPLRKEVSASLYVFGYRKDVPFSNMPKLHVKFGQSGYEAYGRDSTQSSGDVVVERSRDEMTILIPPELLGNPDRILTGAHTRLLGVIPLDWVSWRVLRAESRTKGSEPGEGPGPEEGE